jgi:uncharacterized protein (DUF1810 family)
MHGWGIAHRIERMSNDVFLVAQGSLYPALVRMKRRGWVKTEWRITENSRRRATTSSPPRATTARSPLQRLAAGFRGDRWHHDRALGDRRSRAMSILSDIIERTRALVFRRREERELAEDCARTSKWKRSIESDRVRTTPTRTATASSRSAAWNA